MFTRSIIRLTLALILVCASLLLVTSVTTADAVMTAPVVARPKADLIVNPGESIQAAIDAANDGDTIIINAGAYTESLTLSKPVSLTGVNSDTTIIHAVVGQRVLTVTGATITNSAVISGLTFTGGIDGIIISSTAQPLIQSVIVSANSNTGIDAASSLLTLINTRVISNYYGLKASNATIIASQFISNAVGATIWDTLITTDTVFMNNHQGASIQGPAIIVNGWFENNDAGGVFSVGAITLVNSVFMSNSATYGGGLAAWYYAPITLIGGLFENNRADYLGGAVDASLRTALISGTKFVSNSVSSGSQSVGGAVVAHAATIFNAYFESNRCPNCTAGGLYVVGFATISDSQFLRNTATSGGGVWAGGAFLTGGLFEGNVSNGGLGGGLSAGTLTISGTQFVSNTAMCGGGAFAISPVVINGGRFERNTSNGSGGALCLSTLALTGTEFISNSAATKGGAIFYSNTDADQIRDGRIVNALFSQNSANAGGAALFVQAKDNVALVHVTIAGTDPQLPSAIAISQGTLSVTNTIIANHTIGISNTGGTVTEDYNLYYGNISNTYGVTIGAHSLIGDPRFVDPAHDDYHLLFGSSAIDRGVDTGVYTDLDGSVRPSGSGFDIGAYEFAGGARYVATTGDDASNLCLDQLSPCATVQHAIDVAYDHDEIRIASGTYTGVSVRPRNDITTTGIVTQVAYLSKTLTIRGGYTLTNWLTSDPSINQTVLDARAQGRVFYITGNIRPTLEGLTMRGGYETDPDNHCGLTVCYRVGTAVYGISATITITRSRVASNVGEVTNFGGALFVEHGHLTLGNSQIISNVGSGVFLNYSTGDLAGNFISGNIASNGGGILMLDSAATLSGNQIISNTANYACGGGVCVAYGSQAILSSNLIQNNHASGMASGGGVNVFQAWATLNDNHFIHNQTTGSGGGLYTTNAIILVNDQFSDNTANAAGGGLYTVSAITLTNVDFTSNTTLQDSGGAIEGTDVTVDGGHFVNNSSFQPGGAIFAQNVTVHGAEFIGNRGTDVARASGGAIFAVQASISDSRFERNTATATGGGVCADLANIRHSDFISNTALSGGAVQSNLSVTLIGGYFKGNQAIGSIYSSGGALDLQQADGTAMISGSQFISNSAVARGGAIYLWSGNNNLRITNSLFVNNTAGTAGALLYSESTGAIALMYNTIANADANPVTAIAISQGTLNVADTIIDNYAIGISNTGGLVTEDYNLFYGNLTNTVGVNTGAHSLIGDPRFVDPAHDDYHLLFGSSAIDRGVDTGVYTDLDGKPRPQGADFDIGAYEFTGGIRYVATTGDDASNLCLDQLSPCATVQHAIDVANDGEQILIASGLYTQSATLSKPVSLTGVNSDTTIIHAIAGQRVLTVTGATISNSVVISGLTFMAGLADKGGGILLEQQAQPVIRNLLLYNNRADQGGGLYSYSPVALIDTRVISNGAIHGGGGAYIGMTATLTGGEFFANESWGDGGGVYLEQAATITGTKFGDNHGSNGGGLFADLNAYPGLWVLTNTEFFGNVAQAGGGAALFGTAQITVQIYGGRYENNTASTFGGGLFGDRATLSGTRFISNSAVNSGGGALVYDASVSGALFERNSVSAGDGGGLMVHNLLLRHTTFVSNTASVNGGGLYASDAVTLTNASFISNSADGGAGVFVAGEATVIDSQFTDNAAQSASYAGGLYGYLLHVTNTQFISNSSGHAGGLQAIVADIHNSWFERNTSRGFGGAVAVNDLIMSNTVLIANTSGGGGGGAWVPGNATIIGGRIENNRALGTNPEWSNGGGLLAEFGSLSISGTQFISNSAFTYGGGLSFSSLSNGRIVNALFSRNSASLDGAALASTSGGHLDLVNTTIADTALNPRFAITVLSGTLGITNTIITNHAIGISNTGGTVTEDYNLFHGNLTNTIGVTTGAHSLVGDPRFVDPAHDDYHLVFGSAGIDHGVDAGVYTDLDGSVRPHGVGFDIGAYEYQGMNYRVFLPLIQK